MKENKNMFKGKKILLGIFISSILFSGNASAACPPKFCGGPTIDIGAISANIIDSVNEHTQWIMFVTNQITEYVQEIQQFTQNINTDNINASSVITALTDADVDIYNRNIMDTFSYNAVNLCTDVRIMSESQKAFCENNEASINDTINIAATVPESPEVAQQAIANFGTMAMKGIKPDDSVPDQYDPSSPEEGTNHVYDNSQRNVERMAIQPLPSSIIAKPEGDADYNAKEFIKIPVIGNVRVSSVFSYNRFHPVEKKVKPHKGVDFAGPTGLPIMASQDGVVTQARVMEGYGNVIFIRHDNGIETRYAHLDGFNIGVGATVEKGQVIGTLGNTGISTGPHLHYEYRINGVPQDPMLVGTEQGYGLTLESMQMFSNVGSYNNNTNAMMTGLLQGPDGTFTISGIHYDQYSDTIFANSQARKLMKEGFLNTFVYESLSRPIKMSGYNGETSVLDSLSALGSSEFGSDIATMRAIESDLLQNRSADIAWKNKLQSSSKRLYLKLKRLEHLYAMEAILGAMIKSNTLD